jgi:hypothetical protein
MTRRTACPTRAARIARRLAVLTAAVAGAWTLANALTAEPAWADTPPPVAEVALNEVGTVLDDVTAIVQDVVPEPATGTAVAAIEEAAQVIDSAIIDIPDAISLADPGHEGSTEDPPAVDPLIAYPAPMTQPEPRPAPAEAPIPAKRPLSPRPSGAAVRPPLPAPAPSQSRAVAKRGEVDDHRATKQGGGAPLRTFPDCNPSTSTTGGTPTTGTSPTSVYADLTAVWRPPDLPSVRVHPRDSRAPGLSWRPDAPAG